jgi:hypothetical protein
MADLIHGMPPELWEILSESKISKEEDSAKLRAYFSAPPILDGSKKTIVFSTPSTLGGLF